MIAMKTKKIRSVKNKRPLVKNLNWSSVMDELYEMQEACAYVCYYGNYEDVFLEVFDYDSDEAREFQFAFSTLEADIERLIEDMWESFAREYFDDVFSSVGASSEYGGFLQYDADEGDYFGIDYYYPDMNEESVSHMLRMTKKDMYDAFRMCYKVFQAYVGVKYRYDCLKITLDIVKDKLNGTLAIVNQINEIYELCDIGNFSYTNDVTRKLDQLFSLLPDEAWII